jgi:hypothetical protein
MEFLREVASSLLTFFQSYAEWWARAVGAVCREFGLDVPVSVSNFVGLVLGSIIFVAFFRRLAFWERKGDKPQPFPLKTTETPAEVLAKDRQKQLAAWLRVALFLLFLVLVVTSR